MTKRRPSFPTAEETQPPARKQRKLTKNQAAITAAVYSAILPCLDLIDPLMEFMRACSSTKTSSTKRKTADAQEQKVRAVVDALRERFENPPVPKSPEVVFNEHDEAEVVDSEEDLSDEETDEEEEVEPVKPRRKDKLNVILSQSGGDFVEVYKGTVKPSETVRACEVEEELESDAEDEGKKKAGKRTKKTNKSQTEVERLGGPVQDEPKLRRSSRLKAPDLESLNRVEDSADEEDLEGQDAANEDVSERTDFWWRCQRTDADTGCWCTTWDSLGRPAIWKGGRWI